MDREPRDKLQVQPEEQLSFVPRPDDCIAEGVVPLAGGPAQRVPAGQQLHLGLLRPHLQYRPFRRRGREGHFQPPAYTQRCTLPGKIKHKIILLKFWSWDETKIPFQINSIFPRLCCLISCLFQ